MESVLSLLPFMTNAPWGGGGCSANCRRNGRGDLFDDILALRGAKLFQAGGFLKWDMKCFLNRSCIQNFMGPGPLVTEL